jgi:hypothetical protein
MNSFSRRLTPHKIILLTAEVQMRKNYQRISARTKIAVERWLDKKTSPYGDFTK